MTRCTSDSITYESLSSGPQSPPHHNAKGVDLPKASPCHISCTWPINFRVQSRLLITATHTFMTELLPFSLLFSSPLPPAMFQETAKFLDIHAPPTSRSVPLLYDPTCLFTYLLLTCLQGLVKMTLPLGNFPGSSKYLICACQNAILDPNISLRVCELVEGRSLALSDHSINIPATNRWADK